MLILDIISVAMRSRQLHPACVTARTRSLLVLLLLLATRAAASVPCSAAAHGAQLPPSYQHTRESADAPPEQQQQQQDAHHLEPVGRQLLRASRQRQHQSPTRPRVERAFPVYGNWCGPNYGAGKPIDAMDACCMHHDRCYDDTAIYNHCSCDHALLGCLKAVRLGSNEVRRRTMRGAIETYFKNTVCRCTASADYCMPVRQCQCTPQGLRWTGGSSSGSGGRSTAG